MSESAVDPHAAAEEAVDLEAERAIDRTRMKRIGQTHFIMAVGALTLWGAADAWSMASGWALAGAVAIVNAFIAGWVITSIAHEWAHFSGARLAGARAPVLEKPVNHFFMFDFKLDRNDSRQFAWMSWGGILAPWALVVATLLFVPIDNLSRLTLLAVFAARAAQVALFEVPITLRVSRGGDPRTELGRQLADGGLASAGKLGWAVGAMVWLGIWLLI